jgi:transposase
MAPRNRNNPKRSATSQGTYTRADLDRDFPDDATCLDYLWRRNLSPDGEHAHCPVCGTQRRFHRIKARPSYSCDVCGKHLHPTAGTIFHKSSTGLDLWFRAIFLMGSTRCGVSAKQIERELGVTYKTAWRMANLIRNELMTQDDDRPLEGDVEADETWIGGKPRANSKVKGAAHASQKPIVLGMVERGGRVRTDIIPFSGAGDIRPRVLANVKAGSRLLTDGYGVYRTMAGTFDHHWVDHSAGVYVTGDVHTQTIEGFWSTVKNGIRGTYHAVSRKWLQSYLGVARIGDHPPVVGLARF